MTAARGLSDAAVERLLGVVAEPDLADTRYRLVGPLGRGGMGIVYRAHDTLLDREVALKVLPWRGGGAGGDDLAERLRREARVLARLDHPGIVPVHDLGVLADGRVFYAMKRVRGRRLDEAFRGAPAAGEEGERLRVFERICEAVAFAHDRGVVHRDLKPENVMVGAFGEVLVMDWGVAKVLDEAEPATDGGAGPADAAAASRTATAHGTVLGTPGFMAPEQARGEVGRHDRRVDVHALGALLAWLLTGLPPVPAAADGAADGQAAAGTALADGLPPPLASVVAKAMAADPADRYPGAADLAAEIARYRAARPVAAHREGALERLGRVARKYRVAIGLVLAYLLMRVLFLIFAGF